MKLLSLKQATNREFYNDMIIAFLATILYFPLHEIGHILAANIQGISLLSFNPNPLAFSLIFSRNSLFIFSGGLLILIPYLLLLYKFSHIKTTYAYYTIIGAILLGSIIDIYNIYRILTNTFPF